MKQIQILVVEDDQDINNMLCDLLMQNGYQVKQAYSGTEALLCLDIGTFDIMLLDLMLPGIPGEEVLTRTRKISEMPIIAVSAKDDGKTKVNLLKSGADDYITKPFDIEELLARIEVVLRRNNMSVKNKNSILQFKELTLDTDTLEVKVGGAEVNLTKREFMILELLMKNPNKVYTKNNIYESVWNENYIGEDNAVNVHISNIRQKIAKVNSGAIYIQTVWGIGFKM